MNLIDKIEKSDCQKKVGFSSKSCIREVLRTRGSGLNSPTVKGHSLNAAFFFTFYTRKDVKLVPSKIPFLCLQSLIFLVHLSQQKRFDIIRIRSSQLVTWTRWSHFIVVDKVYVISMLVKTKPLKRSFYFIRIFVLQFKSSFIIFLKEIVILIYKTDVNIFFFLL